MWCARLHWVPEARTQICSPDEVSLRLAFGENSRRPTANSSEGPLLASWGYLGTAGRVGGRPRVRACSPPADGLERLLAMGQGALSTLPAGGPGPRAVGPGSLSLRA